MTTPLSLLTTLLPPVVPVHTINVEAPDEDTIITVTIPPEFFIDAEGEDDLT